MKCIVSMISIVLLLALLYSCNSATQNGKTEITLETSAVELDNRFLQTDSVVIVYYNDPYGADSLRYTRFYKQYTTTSKTVIDTIVNSLKAGFNQEAERRKCRGEGKVWFYSNGHVFETVYFSTMAGNCYYLLVINNGNYYYTKTPNALLQMLPAWKQFASEPELKGNN